MECYTVNQVPNERIFLISVDKCKQATKRMEKSIQKAFCAFFMYSSYDLPLSFLSPFKLPSCQAGVKQVPSANEKRNESHSVSSLLDLVSVNTG